MDRIKVIIADDSDFVRDGMKIILDVDDDFEVIGSASNGREAVELAQKNRPLRMGQRDILSKITRRSI